MVANRLTMNQGCALMAKEASGGQQVDHEPVVSLWPVVATGLTMSQWRPLMANSGPQFDREPAVFPHGQGGQWWPAG